MIETKTLCQINLEILKASKNNHSSWKLLNQYGYIKWGFAEKFQQVVFSCFEIQVISEKHCITKISLAIWETFLHENNSNNRSWKFSDKFAFIPFLLFRRNWKQESILVEVGGLVMRNISVYCIYAFCYFSGTEPKNFLRCCLIHITIIIIRHIFNLVYLPLYLFLRLFISYPCNLIFIFSLIFIVKNSYNLIKIDTLAFCSFSRISPIIFIWYKIYDEFRTLFSAESFFLSL